jgi:hypothetical protein
MGCRTAPAIVGCKISGVQGAATRTFVNVKGTTCGVPSPAWKPRHLLSSRVVGKRRQEHWDKVRCWTWPKISRNQCKDVLTYAVLLPELNRSFRRLAIVNPIAPRPVALPMNGVASCYSITVNKSFLIHALLLVSCREFLPILV